jgi:hypothetical protein
LTLRYNTLSRDTKGRQSRISSLTLRSNTLSRDTKGRNLGSAH